MPEGDFEFSIECDGFKDKMATDHLIHAIGGITLKFNDSMIKELEDEMSQTIVDIVDNFPKKSGATVKDIHLENHGDGWLEIWTDNKVVMWIEWGTEGHGPKTAPYLVFKLDDGTIIRTKWVRGIKPHYVIKKALMRLSGRIQAMQ